MIAAMSKHSNFFNERVSLFVALAPVTKVTHTQDELLKFSSQKMQLIEEAEVHFLATELEQLVQ